MGSLNTVTVCAWEERRVDGARTRGTKLKDTMSVRLPALGILALKASSLSSRALRPPAHSESGVLQGGNGASKLLFIKSHGLEKISILADQCRTMSWVVCVGLSSLSLFIHWLPGALWGHNKTPNIRTSIKLRDHLPFMVPIDLRVPNSECKPQSPDPETEQKEWSESTNQRRWEVKMSAGHTSCACGEILMLSWQGQAWEGMAPCFPQVSSPPCR